MKEKVVPFMHRKENKVSRGLVNPAVNELWALGNPHHADVPAAPRGAQNPYNAILIDVAGLREGECSRRGDKVRLVYEYDQGMQCFGCTLRHEYLHKLRLYFPRVAVPNLGSSR